MSTLDELFALNAVASGLMIIGGTLLLFYLRAVHKDKQHRHHSRSSHGSHQ